MVLFESLKIIPPPPWWWDLVDVLLVVVVVVANVVVVVDDDDVVVVGDVVAVVVDAVVDSPGPIDVFRPTDEIADLTKFISGYSPYKFVVPVMLNS